MSDARELADWHERCAIQQAKVSAAWDQVPTMRDYYFKSAEKHADTAALLRAQPSAEPVHCPSTMVHIAHAQPSPAPPREAGRKVCNTVDEYWAAMTEWLRAQPIAAKGVFRDD